MNFVKQTISFFVGTSILASSALVQAEKIAITGAQIHTMASAGVIEEGTLLLDKGKIQQVLDSKSVPSGYREIDASGKVVTPGFIGALTSLGLQEVSLSAGIVDARVDAHPVSPVGAAYDVQYGVNADSTLLPITRVEGFTHAVTGLSRTGQLFNGQGAVISLSGEFDAVVKPQAYVHVDVSENGADTNGESRAAMWVALNQSLDEAMFAANVDLSPTEDWEGMITRADAKALMPVLKGEVPLLVTANRASDILQALAIKQRYSNVDLVLVNAVEGWRVAEQIAEAQVPVILNPENNLPGGFDQLGATLENAARLHKAGVLVAIGMDTHNIRLAPQHAGNAVANGLPHAAGIASLTLNIAKIFGLTDTLGSLEPGKEASLVIWSGDPLEVTQAAEQVFIKGEPVEMTSRQIQLRDRYMKRDPAKPVGYTR
ncbi:amidohydrolase family protein [Glaciecola siphonariae]|uniref:Amidohydrolase family protein n=1 Tax=Glaciecola siphonariae TaxID=521012 RepID=A0ABV9LRA3_9ALTE